MYCSDVTTPAVSHPEGRREQKVDERKCWKIDISMKTFGLACEVDTLTRRRLKRSEPWTVLKGKAGGGGHK